MNKKLFFKLFALIGILSISAYAGTGGSEAASWYTDISGALKGTWGKVIAVAFLGFTIILFKSGSIIAGIFMMLVGLGIGSIPDMVDAKYTALMFEIDSYSYIDSFQNKLLGLLNKYY
jgi:hypothetical protein